MSRLNDLINLRKNPTVRSISIYTFTNFFSKGASFLLLFIFTNPVYILPSENGLLSLFSNSMLFLMPFISMGIIHSTSTDFFKLDKQSFRSFFTTGFVMPISVTVFFVIIALVFQDHLLKAYGLPPTIIWLIPIITFLNFCNEQLLSVIRNSNEPIMYLKVNITKIILELGLSVVLVVFFAMRWQGRVTGILVAYIVMACFGMYYFTKKGFLFGKVKKQYIVNELLYAIPIIVMQVSFFTMNASDRFFLSSFTTDNNETVGIYSIACILGSVIVVLCMALFQYFFPKIYTMLAMPVVDYASIRKHFWWFVVIMAIGTIAVILLTPLIYQFINEKYHPALRYTYIICAANFIWSVTYFFFSFLLFNKQKKIILALSCCCIVLSLGLNYFFISRWKDDGAATASFTTYFIVLILTLLFTKEHWSKFLFRRSVK